MAYLLAFIAAFGISLGLSMVVRAVALRVDYVDDPAHAPERTVHRERVPYGGGIVLLVSVIIVIVIVMLCGWWPHGAIKFKELIGLFVGALVLLIGGTVDDRKALKPRYQLIAPLIAISIVLASGIGISTLTNPLGNHFSLAWWHTPVFWLHGVFFIITLPADALTIIWLLSTIYTTKLLDGLDGLVSGITTMGAVVLFFVSLLPVVGQNDTAMLSIVLAGAAFALMIVQCKKRMLFLGEGGSTIAGFFLGVFAIINGGKIATTMLIMGIPFFDLVWVMARRALWERTSITNADRKHLHFRLLDAGFTQPQAVGLYLGLSFVFGLSAIMFQTVQKFRVLALMVIVMVVVAVTIVRLGAKNKNI